MQRNKLIKFIIYSVAFHLVLISAILLYFYKHPITGGKAGTVMVGIISGEDISNGKSPASSGTEQSQPEKVQESAPKIALEQSPVRKTVKNHKEVKKKTQKQITKNVTNTNSKSKQITESGNKSENKSKGQSKTASIEPRGSETIGQPEASGTVGHSTELAYPDYNHNPKPKYPKVARKRGYEGEVKLKVFVLANGKVGKIEIIRPSGHEILDQSALKAVRDWVFVPGKENGKEISSWVTVPITFQLKSG